MEELAARVFVASCEKGDLAAVKEALDAGIPVNCSGRDDSTGLMRAIAMRHQQVVDELLLHPDIDINLPGMGNDITPLHVACISDNVPVIQKLTSMPRLTCINSRTREGWTPLMAAIANGNEGAVRAMLDVPGLDLNAKDGNGRTIVEVAREVGNQTIEKLLMEKCEK